MTVSLGDIAAIIVAIAVVALVVLLARPLIKLNSTLDQATETLKTLNDGVGPLLEEATVTVSQAQKQLEHVDAITQNLKGTSDQLQRVTGSVLGFVESPVSRTFGLISPIFRFLTGRKK